MKALAAFLLLASTSVFSAELPVVVIDAAHSQLDQPEGKDAPSYSIPASSGIKIDARKFDFARSSYPNIRPNSIQVLLKDKQYFVKWNGSAVIELTSQTMAPLNNTPKFSGFKAGDAAVIGIGEQRTDHLSKEIAFKVQWAGLVNVK